MEDEELKDCPFCGDSDVYLNEEVHEVEPGNFQEFYNIYCPMCCASVFYEGDKDGTISAWNKRSQ